MSTIGDAYAQARHFGFKLNDAFIEADLADTGSSSTTSQNFEKLKARLLDYDLRKKPCLDPFFPPEINNLHSGVLAGPVVLQIASVGNFSQPISRRTEDNNPRMLVIHLTDGHTKCAGIEMQHLHDFHANCPPGGKILYLGGNVRNGKLLLTPQNCKYLGGEVEQLLEVYKANAYALKMRKLTGGGKKSEIAAKASAMATAGGGGPPQFELKLTRTIQQSSTSNAAKASSTKASTVKATSADSKTTASVPPPSVSVPAAAGSAQTSGKHKDHQHQRGKDKSGSSDRLPVGTVAATVAASVIDRSQSQSQISSETAATSTQQAAKRPQRGPPADVNGNRSLPSDANQQAQSRVSDRRGAKKDARESDAAAGAARSDKERPKSEKSTTPALGAINSNGGGHNEPAIVTATNPRGKHESGDARNNKHQKQQNNRSSEAIKTPANTGSERSQRGKKGSTASLDAAVAVQDGGVPLPPPAVVGAGLQPPPPPSPAGSKERHKSDNLNLKSQISQWIGGGQPQQQRQQQPAGRAPQGSVRESSASQQSGVIVDLSGATAAPPTLKVAYESADRGDQGQGQGNTTTSRSNNRRGPPRQSPPQRIHAAVSNHTGQTDKLSENVAGLRLS